MKAHNFYRQFANINLDDRMAFIDVPKEPTSLFVIFKKLQHVREQRRCFEKQEEHLLALAEIGFNQLNKTNEKTQKDIH